MTQRRLRLAPAPFDAAFGDRGELRCKVGQGGLLHLDRWLPFLILHRSGEDAAPSLARRIARNSPAYLVWSAAEDPEAHSALDHVLGHLGTRFERLLLIDLADAPLTPDAADAPRLPPFLFELDIGRGTAARRAATALEKALSAIRIDLRRAKVETAERAPPAAWEAVAAAHPGVRRLSLTIPPLHRAPDGGVYPQLAHDLAVASGDALLRAACAFLDDGRGGAPVHYRSLGRSAYLAAALKADRKLDRISRSFDFLLSVSPINTGDALERFLERGGEEPPQFRYRPLTVDPDLAKRDLYKIDLARLEDPLLERLLGEKRREIDQQLTMLETRNTPGFRPASMLVYGAVAPALLADAEAILAAGRRDARRAGKIGAERIAAEARRLIAAYQERDPRFRASVEIRKDVTGLLVSNGRLMIGCDTAIATHRLDPLLAHEVSVHLLTWFNGATQGLTIFRTGLAGYEGIQEGLGVFAEWAVGGLSWTRLRLLAGRVVAVAAMQGGAGFIDVYRLLHRDKGFSPRAAFGIAARVLRSGGFAKDAIYLKGFRDVLDLVADGIGLDPFWLGKIAPAHTPAIEELLQRNLLHAPTFLPEFLNRADTRQRIARLRAGGSFDALMDGE